MTKATDFTKAMQDAFAAFPTAPNAFQDVFKSQAVYGEKITQVAIEAAEKSADLSARWTKDTLARLSDMTRVQSEAKDYTAAATAFASASAEMASENLAAFAEIAKKAQTETIELMMSAGKEFQADAAAAMKAGASEFKGAPKKAGSK